MACALPAAVARDMPCPQPTALCSAALRVRQPALRPGLRVLKLVTLQFVDTLQSLRTHVLRRRHFAVTA